MIPVIKVNYKLWELLEAAFIPCSRDKYLPLLEKEVCRYFGVDEALFACSGRSALYFILKGLPQRKVVVPAYTCDAVAEAVALAGKEIVYAHVGGPNLDMVLEGLVDSDTIVVATHQFGMPCNIGCIRAMCKTRGAIVVEDCAGALGTRIDGRLAGTFGDFAFFSFNASKLVTAPAMGGFAISANPGEIRKLKQTLPPMRGGTKHKVRSLLKSVALCLYKHPVFHDVLARAKRKRRQGEAHLDAQTYHAKPTLIEEFQYPFCDWQAKTVLRQFKKIDSLLAARQRMFDAFMGVLRKSRIPLGFANVPTGNRFPLLVENREEAVSRFRAHGIATAAGFDHFVCPGDYTDELRLADRILYLPFGSGFTGKEIAKVASVLETALPASVFAPRNQ